MKVLQGIIGQAGQPYAISRGLRKIGIDSDCVLVQEHKFGYPSDIRLDIPREPDIEGVHGNLQWCSERYDIAHFHARSFLSSPTLHEFPSGLDLLSLRLMGMKVIFHFRGSEVRSREQFAAANPYNYAYGEAASRLFDKISDDGKKAFIPFIQGVCNKVLVIDPELQGYVPGAVVVPRALNAEDWDFVGPVNAEVPTVVHAPSRRGVKGTDAILAAVNKLKAEGLRFDFQLVENMPNAEARSLYTQADIIIDQLRIGWHGVLAVEGMALGKTVITYIRDDLWHSCGTRPPVLNANPDTLSEVLREAIRNKELRQRMGAEARQYFEQTHSSTSVANLLKTIYTDVLADPTPPDSLAVMRYLNRQFELAGSKEGISKAEDLKRTASAAHLAQTLDDLPRPVRLALSAYLVYRTQGTRTMFRETIRYLRGQS